MGKPKVLRTTFAGEIRGLRVVGYHGRLGADQTPARCGAVHVDAEDRLVEILEARAAPSKAGKSGRYEVAVEIVSPALTDDAFSHAGTRIGPWPARLDAEMIIVGEHERRHATGLAEKRVEGEPTRVRAFLSWLAGTEPRSVELQAERVGEVCAWYCSTEEAFALWQRLAPLARKEVRSAASQGNDAALRVASLWLSRAAVTDEDIFLAVAGLRRASYPHWKVFLDAGVRSGTEEERRAAVDAAEKELPQAAPGQRWRSAMRERQREAIKEGFAPLEPPGRAA